MKSEKVLNDLFEYLILFGSRTDPNFNNTIQVLNYVLQDDLPVWMDEHRLKELE